MNDVRRDIAEAMGRMRVTFGTRGIIRNLDDVLEEGEVVREMVAATYSGGDGLLVLTDRRAIAVRDDYSKYRVQHVALADTYAVDYAPKVHDGLGVLTPTSRVAVRRMDRRDSDRLVDVLLAEHPHVVVGSSRPKKPITAVVAPDSVSGGQATGAAPVPGPAPDAATVAPAPAAAESPAKEGPTPQAVAAVTPPATQAPAPVSPAPSVPSAPSVSPAPNAAVAARTATDTEVLVSVLADLHAKGVLTADELAAKIVQVTSG